MRKSLQLLFAVLLLNTSLLAQNFYTVQVGTFLDAKRSDFEAIEPLGFVHADRLQGNLYQIYLGGFDEQAKADRVLAEVKKKGYPNAFVQERLPESGEKVTVIQIALKTAGKPIEWDEYLEAGSLYAILNGDKVKLATGLYSSVDAAKRDLGSIRGMGFKDAFIKNVNTIFLRQITDFETGGAKKKDLNAMDDNASRSRTAPEGYDAAGGRILTGETMTAKTPESRPAGYDYGSATPPPAAMNVSPAPRAPVDYPDIRPRVKRRSALELQKVLKGKGYYTSTLDGLYGAGTAQAYEAYKQGERGYQKYLLLSRYGPALTGQSGEQAQLQTAVNNLLDDPQAVRTIEKSTQPIAQAYQAYLLYQRNGPGQEVNSLMNSAIKGAFVGKQLKGQPPLDYRATYAYDNLQQLILHIHYVHSAPDIQIAVPCWLFQQHPAETGYAYETYARSAADYPLQTCDQFLEWEEIGALRSIAFDLHASNDLDSRRLASAASHRAMLFLAPEKLTTMEKQTLEAWNSRLMRGLEAWGKEDPLHSDLVTAFTVAFYQSQVRLEDFFMNKGLSAEDAKGLSLATLHTIVAYPLERFV